MAAPGHKVQVGRLEIETIEDGTTRVISLAGELDADGSPALDSALAEAERRSEGPIVIDMSRLTFIDSSGIALLVAGLRRSREGHNRLRFVPSQSEDVQRLLELCGLDSHLPLAD